MLKFSFQELMGMQQDDPKRLEKMRMYGAIYGRFDSKRKNEKHMSLHEVGILFDKHACWKMIL